MRSLFALAVAMVGLGFGAWIAPGAAYACGGFFCSTAPTGPTTFGPGIVQSGEQIVFGVEEDGTIEAHVQIRYAGTAESFGWVVPVPAEPELDVGTDALFDLLQQRTAPTFTLTRRTTGTCGGVRRDSDSGGGCLFGMGGDDDRPGVSDAGASIALDGASLGDGGPPPVDVRSRQSLGPYDAVVLRAFDAGALWTWLTDNGWDVPEESIPLIMEYVDHGDFFVALKLLPEAGVDQIQPIVLRYREEQPCVPIRLTAIATVDDLPITVYVLGGARAVPWNYAQTEADLASVGFWTTNGSAPTYDLLISMGVDEAGGRAFVTEYAGPPPRGVGGVGLRPLDDLRRVLDRRYLLAELERRGYLAVPGVQALVDAMLPVGPSHEPSRWCWTPPRWDHGRYPRRAPCRGPPSEDALVDGTVLVDAIDALVLGPQRRAEDLLRRHPWITRMFTTLSAEEMTEDPLFVFAPSMGRVDNQQTATLLTECTPRHLPSNAPQKLVLESGVELEVSPGRATLTDSDDCALAPGPSPPRSPLLWLLLTAGVLVTVRRR